MQQAGQPTGEKPVAKTTPNGGRAPVTDTHTTRLVRRVVQEHRRAVVLMAGGCLVNILLYVFIVRPLTGSVATVEQRTAGGGTGETAAQAEFDQSQRHADGQGSREEGTRHVLFEVLAQDLSGARRLTYGRVQRLAQENRLAYQGSRTSRSRSGAAR